MAGNYEQYYDLSGIVEDVMDSSGVTPGSTVWGDSIPEKEDAARQYFAVPRNDDVYLILDTTLFGSCKVGLALATSGICMNDESGAVRVIDWYEFGDAEVYYEDGTLTVDGSQFFSSDGEPVCEVILQVLDWYDQQGGEFDLYGIVEDVMDSSGVTPGSTVWGDSLSEKEDDARQHFAIPRDDEVFLVLDTTLFGSCKVGLALTTSGVCMRDEDGAVRRVEWYELRDGADFSYGGGTLTIDDSKFFSADGEYIYKILNEVVAEL